MASNKISVARGGSAKEDDRDESLTLARFQELKTKHANLIAEMKVSNDMNTKHAHTITEMQTSIVSLKNERDDLIRLQRGHDKADKEEKENNANNTSRLQRIIEYITDERDALRERLQREPGRFEEAAEEASNIERLADTYAGMMDVDPTEIRNRRTINGVDHFYGVAVWFHELMKSTFDYVNSKLRGQLGNNHDGMLATMIDNDAIGSLCQMMRQYELYIKKKDKFTTKINHQKMDKNLSREYVKFIRVLVPLMSGNSTCRHCC